MKNLKIRWALQSDIRRVLDIEKKCFRIPWDTNDFKYFMSQRNTIAMVACIEERVVGYFVYQIFAHEIVVLNFAVTTKCQRNGIGRKMVDYIKSKMKGAVTVRNSIRLICSDRNLPAHLFFKACGFKADKIEYHAFGLEEDGYQFKFWAPSTKKIRKVKGKKPSEQQQ